MRISDWSSDVCSSDLLLPGVDPGHASPAAGTQAPERRARSANDATEDTKRRIAEDEAIRRRAEEEAARTPTSKAGPERGQPPEEDRQCDSGNQGSRHPDRKRVG